ncbi:MAG: iron-containing alcohol dehydrogenase [Candidatus Hodarchaeales archaeon]|jgi:alcohol dehydrogenase class IV
MIDSKDHEVSLLWTFTSPKAIAFGEDALDELQSLAGRGSRALIITDKIVEELYLSKLTTVLADIGFEWCSFNEVEPDPSYETCEKAAKIAEEFKPDWIFGLGGGSVLDTTKAAFFMYERPDEDISGAVPFLHFNLRQKTKGLVTIPTTSGTGAEVTPAMVITVEDGESHRKINPTTREVIADLVIIDPVFTMMMPKKLTAITGLDALTHAVEAYISQWRNDFSDGLAIHALKIIFEYLPRAFKHGKDDKEARERMHNAATISGVSFASSNVDLAHGLGHALGAVVGLPHGLCVGVYLPRIVEFVARTDLVRVVQLARELGINEEDDNEAAKKFVQKIEKLMNEIEIPPRIKYFLDISEDDFMSKLNRLVNLAGVDTSNISTIRPPTDEEYRKLFIAGYHGTNVDF